MNHRLLMGRHNSSLQKGPAMKKRLLDYPNFDSQAHNLILAGGPLFHLA